MKDFKISFRFSEETMNQLNVICEKYHLGKTAAIENAINAFFEKINSPSTTLKESVEKHFNIIVDQIKSAPTVLQNSIDEHAEEIIQESIDSNKKISTPVFHLSGEVVKFENRFVKRGELADVRYNKNINIRDVMRAYRYKMRGKSYDETMEQYFGLLTEDYKNLINGKTS
jgi:hypothetical protein